MENKSNFMSLDLEFEQPTKEIVQVGLCVIDITTGIILEKYCNHVNIHKQLSDFIKNLCHISQNDIDNGTTLEEIYKDICNLHTRYECFRNPISWGGGDSDQLRQDLHLDDEKFVFGRRWIDCKTVFISYCLSNNIKTQSGLSKSMGKVGLQFKGRKHNAMDDAINTAILYKHLLDKFKEVKNVQENHIESSNSFSIDKPMPSGL